MVSNDPIHNQVQEYYGKTLQSSQDLKTSCCTAGAPPAEHREIMALIDDDIVSRFYGCGSPIPDAVEGLTVLDLGCGTGRDCYILSKLVGPEGSVIGVDMTEEQLEVGRRHRDSMAQKFGFSEPNVDFRHGIIEDLAACGIEDNSVDLVISNCVLNLAPEKFHVFSEIFRVLKPGGELYFSDVYADRRVPEDLRDDPVFRGECLGGALYTEDFRRLLAVLGCPDSRIISSEPIKLEGGAVAEQAGNIRFFSVTVRAFKLPSLEDRAEDYGEIATYKGSIPGRAHAFELDADHIFEAGRPMLVSGNTASMLMETRFAQHFDVSGDRNMHYGHFIPRHT